MRRLGILAFALAMAACSTDEAGDKVPAPPEITLSSTEERVACADRNPLRNVYWGDLHIHTSLSFDAYAHGIRHAPADAYRFAKGEQLLLPPLDAEGKGTRPVQLSAPLDFAAVTDHAEYLAEIWACTSPESAAYDIKTCVDYRKGGTSAYVAFGIGLATLSPVRFEELCQTIECRGEPATGIWDVIR